MVLMTSFLTEDGNYYSVSFHDKGVVDIYASVDGKTFRANNKSKLGLISQLTYEPAVEFIQYMIFNGNFGNFFEDDKIKFCNGSIFNLT